MNPKHEPLFTPFSIRNTQIKNRYFMAAMGTVTHNDEDGAYEPDAVDYFVRRAAGGVGLIITGANWVDNNIEVHSAGSFPCPTICPGKYIKTAREITDRVHAFDSKIFVQLTAGLGRSAMPAMIHNRKFVAPSTVSNRWNPRIECRELTTEEVERIVEQFGVSAVIAKKCGYDGVEVHAVHEGYLLDCFSMSLFNHRTDKYGGDLHGRLRFATEIVRKIKKYCGEDFPVILRFSLKSYIKDIRQGAVPGEEFTELGRDTEEGLEAAKILVEAGYDALDVDAGTYDSWYWAHPPMYFDKGVYLQFAEQVKKVVDVPVLAAGRMDDPDLAAQALLDGRCDMIGLARPLLTEPDYVKKVRNGELELIRPCLCCHEGCFGRAFDGAVGSCAVNPECSRERLVGIRPAAEKKRVVVVGGGPAGLEAARVSAMRGHSVTLLEASSALGGALKPAGVPHFKQADRDLVAWYGATLKKLGVDVRLNTRADKAAIDAFNPQTVFVAEGSTHKKLNLPGADGSNVVSALDVLEGKTEVGNCVVVIGAGLVACELALHLLQNGHNVTILARRKLLCSSKLPAMNEFMLRDLLVFHGANIVEGADLKSIDAGGVHYEHDGAAAIAEGDTVVTAVGMSANHTVFDSIRNDYEDVIALGDGRRVRNIMGAVWDGYEAARSL